MPPHFSRGDASRRGRLSRWIAEDEEKSTDFTTENTEDAQEQQRFFTAD
jgi:hypothetical protein